MRGFGLDLSGSGLEPCGSTKRWEFLEQMSNWWVLGSILLNGVKQVSEMYERVKARQR
jgi:hypothetical protein